MALDQGNKPTPEVSEQAKRKGYHGKNQPARRRWVWDPALRAAAESSDAYTQRWTKPVTVPMR